MKINEFKIGESFFTGSGEWTCTDIGTRSILAVKVGKSITLISFVYDVDTRDSKEGQHTMTWDVIKTNPFLLGENEVFEEFDFGGCRLEDTFTRTEK